MPPQSDVTNVTPLSKIIEESYPTSISAPITEAGGSGTTPVEIAYPRTALPHEGIDELITLVKVSKKAPSGATTGGVAATGSLEFALGLIGSGDLILDDGVNSPVTFVLVLDGFDPGGTGTRVSFSSSDSTATLATKMRDAINAEANLAITATVTGTKVNLTNDNTGLNGNQTIEGGATGIPNYVAQSGMSGGAGPGVKATGTIVCVAASSIVTGDTLTVGDGKHPPLTMTFWKYLTDTKPAGNYFIPIGTGNTAIEIAFHIAGEIQNSFTALLAVSATHLDPITQAETSTVRLTSLDAGSAGNVSITSSVSGFTITGMSGGTGLGGGQKPSGFIDAVATSSIINGETFTIGDGINAATKFKFVIDGVDPGGTGVVVNILTGDIASVVASNMKTAINNVKTTLRVNASLPSDANSDSNRILLEQQYLGTSGNVAVTETLTNSSFVVSGLNGGTSAPAVAEVLTFENQRILSKTYQYIEWSYYRNGGCGPFRMLLREEFPDMNDALTDGWEIHVQIKLTGETDYTTWYRGVIRSVEKRQGAQDVLTEIRGQGYLEQLANIQVQRRYPKGQTVENILLDILENYVKPGSRIIMSTDSDVTNRRSGIDQSRYVIQGPLHFECSALKAIKFLSELQGDREYGIASNREFYFREKKTTFVDSLFTTRDLINVTDAGKEVEKVNQIKVEGKQWGFREVLAIAKDVTDVTKFGLFERPIEVPWVEHQNDGLKWAENIIAKKKAASSWRKVGWSAVDKRLERNHPDGSLGMLRIYGKDVSNDFENLDISKIIYRKGGFPVRGLGHVHEKHQPRPQSDDDQPVLRAVVYAGFHHHDLVEELEEKVFDQLAAIKGKHKQFRNPGHDITQPDIKDVSLELGTLWSLPAARDVTDQTNSPVRIDYWDYTRWRTLVPLRTGDVTTPPSGDLLGEEFFVFEDPTARTFGTKYYWTGQNWRRIDKAPTVPAALNVKEAGTTIVTGATDVDFREANVEASGTQAQVFVDLPFICQGRLTVVSGDPIPDTGSLAANTIYFTPYKGSQVSLYDGTKWRLYKFTELSIVLTATLTSGKNYDLFVYDNAGTLTLEKSAAWTNDTTRADAIVLQDGVWVKSGATTRRYLGTFRAIGISDTADAANRKLLWNYYHRTRRTIRQTYGTNSWSYATASYRQANGDGGNQIDVVVGLVESHIHIHVVAYSNADNAGAFVYASIGEDSTTAPVSGVLGQEVRHGANDGTNNRDAAHAILDKQVPLGYHTYVWLERSDGTSRTFYGDNGDSTLLQSGITGFIDS